MSMFSEKALYWTPRGLSIAFLAFLSLFSLDVFGHQLGFWQTALALTMHLIPVFVLTAALVLAWRWEWIGAAMYAAAALLYIYWVVSLTRPITALMRVNWILIIAGPAFLIAGCFLANWLRRREFRRVVAR